MDAAIDLDSASQMGEIYGLINPLAQPQEHDHGIHYVEGQPDPDQR